ncbi:MAG: Uncharacterized protein XD86_1226 [Mesotoga infera]|uniref:4Fe-4S ferredoxin-type domain-containing protein n=1 Tax=Mesotoga infera TaxID=1236046 RepID=A0A101GXH8_9BACT|nr:MAG: Uncharacterized protein XD86_1226 [Mesotoga infera]
MVLDFRDWSGQSTIFGKVLLRLDLSNGDPFQTHQLALSKLRLKRLKTPTIFKNNVFRWTILLLFLSLMVAVRVFKIKVNLLLYITVFSLLITLVFEEEFWHRYMCPFGTLLSLFSRKPLFGMKVEKPSCVSCWICQTVCPVSAIEKENDGIKIDTSECLVCLKWKESCPEISIKYSIFE